MSEQQATDGHATRTTTVPSFAVSSPTSVRGWETRLGAGLALSAVPSEIRSPLEGALGMAGVEAEYFLTLARSLHSGASSSATVADAASARARGEAFLVALEAAGRRLRATASRLVVAIHPFLSALAASHPSVRSDAESAPPWWDQPDPERWTGLTIEMDLRRHGYSLRQVAQARLGEIVEALCERMALTLQALATLPPAGVLPVATLAAGLEQLAELWQEDIANGLVRDISPEYPGLLTALAQLRAEDAAQGADLEADIAWAHAQYALAHGSQQQATQRVEGSMVRAAERAAIVNEAMRSWQDTITTLEQMRATVS